MCGRYFLFEWARGEGLDPDDFDLDELTELWHRYHLEHDEPEDRFNLAPTAWVPVLLRSPTDGTLKLIRAHWGLIPRWAKDEKMAWKTFNARTETVAEKPSFRTAWAKDRRCLVPMSGYYEWTGDKGDKQPHAVSAASGAPLAAAGLWEYRAKPTPMTSFTVLTVPAGPDTVDLHHRSPVLLPPSQWLAWLGPGESPLDDPARVLVPPAKGTLKHRAVSRFVSNSRNQGPECLADPEP